MENIQYLFLASGFGAAIAALVLGVLQVKIYRATQKHQMTGFQVLSRRLDDAKLELVNAAYLTSSEFKYPVPIGGPSIDSHHARTLVFASSTSTRENT